MYVSPLIYCFSTSFIELQTWVVPPERVWAPLQWWSPSGRCQTIETPPTVSLRSLSCASAEQRTKSQMSKGLSNPVTLFPCSSVKKTPAYSPGGTVLDQGCTWSLLKKTSTCGRLAKTGKRTCSSYQVSHRPEKTDTKGPTSSRGWPLTPSALAWDNVTNKMCISGVWVHTQNRSIRI